MNSQKVGGIAAILEAFLYIIGFIFLAVFLSPEFESAPTNIDKLRFTLDNKVLFQVWNILIYIIFGVILIPLTISINENFKNSESISTKVTPVLGFIWAVLVIASGMIANIGLDTLDKMIVDNVSAAITSWKTIGVIQNGLGGGVELVGGLWVLLISINGLSQKVFPKILNYLGLLVGIAGILTMVPGLKDLGMVFGLTQIVWFLWIGIHMITLK